MTIKLEKGQLYGPRSLNVPDDAFVWVRLRGRIYIFNSKEFNLLRKGKIDCVSDIYTFSDDCLDYNINIQPIEDNKMVAFVTKETKLAECLNEDSFNIPQLSQGRKIPKRWVQNSDWMSPWQEIAYRILEDNL